MFSLIGNVSIDIFFSDGDSSLFPLVIVEVSHTKVCVHTHGRNESNFVFEHVVQKYLDVCETPRWLPLYEDFFSYIEEVTMVFNK